MKLTIITINYNNAIGLQKTIESVFAQTSNDFEYIIVDGDSTDASKEIIARYDSFPTHPYRWISEKDNGIYHAMNKGIQLASGDFIQFLNSGDTLVTQDVTKRMLEVIPDNCNVFYGNMLKQLPKRIIMDKGFEGRLPTMMDFYTGTLNHSPAYIKRSLFETYGLYDESLKIVSDWKWYLQVIVLNGVIPEYKDLDVSLFDMNGISNINSQLEKTERKQVIAEILPILATADYESLILQLDKINRLNRYWITRNGIWFIERVLFKWEKWNKNRDNHY